jgi:hypothetical protein
METELARQQVTVDRVLGLVDVRMSGYFDPETAGWAGEEVRAVVRSLGDRMGQHLTLYDASEVQVAPSATIDLLQQSFGNPQVRELWARKVAFVVPSALGRMQIRRLRKARADIGIFEDRASALAWLLAP